MDPAFMSYDQVASSEGVLADLRSNGGALITVKGRGFVAIPLRYDDSGGSRERQVDAIAIVDDFASPIREYASVRRRAFVHARETRFPPHRPRLSGSRWWTEVLDTETQRICRD